MAKNNPIDDFFKRNNWGVMSESDSREYDIILPSDIYEEQESNALPQLLQAILDEIRSENDNLQKLGEWVIEKLFSNLSEAKKKILSDITYLVIASKPCGVLVGRNDSGKLAETLFTRITKPYDTDFNGSQFAQAVRACLRNSGQGDSRQILPTETEILLWVLSLEFLFQHSSDTTDPDICES
jgi:hypothetical protein